MIMLKVVRLKETHSTYKKIKTVERLMKLLGLKLWIRHDGNIMFSDVDNPNIEFFYRDINSTYSDKTNIINFPHNHNIKILYKI